jgi:chromosome segregation ATPase
MTVSDTDMAEMKKWARATMESLFGGLEARVLKLESSTFVHPTDSMRIVRADGVPIREACRRRMPLDGSDAQCLEHAITITERERDDQANKLADAERENGKLKEDNAEVHRHVAVMCDAAAKLRQRAEDAEAGLVERKGVVTQMGITNHVLSGENFKLAGMVNDLEKKQEIKQLNLDELARTLAKAGARENELVATLAAANLVISDRGQGMARQQAEIVRLNGRLDGMTVENTNLRIELDRLRGKGAHEACNTEIGRLKARVKELEAELESRKNTPNAANAYQRGWDKGREETIAHIVVLLGDIK